MNTQNETTLKVNVVVSGGVGGGTGGSPGAPAGSPGTPGSRGNQPTTNPHAGGGNAGGTQPGGMQPGSGWNPTSSSWSPNFGGASFGGGGGSGAWGTNNMQPSSHPGNIPPQLIPPMPGSGGGLAWWQRAGLGASRGILGAMSGNGGIMGTAASMISNPMSYLRGAAGTVAGGTFGLAAAGYGALQGANKFMQSYNADGEDNLGHKSLWHRADGSNMWAAENRIMNSWVGGGKVDRQGNFRNWDYYQGVTHNVHNERLRRTGQQSVYQGFKAQEFGTQLGMEDTQAGYSSRMKGIAANQGFDASSAYIGTQDPLLKSIMQSNKVLYGDEKQAEREYAMSSRQVYGQSLNHNERVNNLLATKTENSLEQQKTLGQIGKAEKELTRIQGDKQFGDRNTVSSAEIQAQQKLLSLKEQMVNLTGKQATIEHSIRDATRDQQRALVQAVRGRLADVQSKMHGEEMSKRGSMESFGMMEVGDQEYVKQIAQRWKQGGFKSVTPEEAQQLMGTPLAEDVQIAARQRGKEAGFDDLFKGSRQEARMGALGSEEGQLVKLEAAITKELNVTVAADADEFAKKVVEYMAGWIRQVEANAKAVLELQTKQQDQQNQVQGQKSTGAPAGMGNFGWAFGK